MGILPALPGSDDLLPEVLIRVGGQFPVAEADGQAVLDDAVEGLFGGNVRQGLGGEGETVDHGVPDGGRFLGEHLTEALVGSGLGVGLVDVLDEDGDQADGEEGLSDILHWDAVQPGAGGVAARPVGEEHQSYATHRDEGREACEFGSLGVIK